MLIELVSVFAALRPLGDALALEFQDFRLDRAGDRVSDLVLKLEEVCKVPIIPLRHYMMIRIGADQLRSDPNPAARFAYATLQHVKCAELLCDLFDVGLLALISERRISVDYRESAPPSQPRDDIVGDTVCEKFLLRVATEIR